MRSPAARTPLEQLEASMLGPLCQHVQQADCSGGFVLLSVSLNPDAAADSFSGLYVQRSNAEHTTSDLLLYRGMTDIGRQHRVMPHRKWAQEFCPADFPGLADQLEAASAPIERACRTTELLTLPGTTEQAILLSGPMVGADGRVYGCAVFPSTRPTSRRTMRSPPLSAALPASCRMPRRGWMFKEGF